MIKISPEIEFGTECPKDGTSLVIEGVTIPGMRCLADALCPTCGTRYYVDLPVGQAVWSPIVLDQKTAEVYDPFGVWWFSELFEDAYLNPVKDDVVPTVHKFYDAGRIVIVNCLDIIYGHSLLKLLNTQRYLDEHPELGCCVLVPTQLKHLVPDGVAEIWEFPARIREGYKWYPSLQRWMDEQLARREECFLSPVYFHPSHRIYDLDRFVRDLPDISGEESRHQPMILYNYREDRLWGRTLAQQQRKIQRLYERLSAAFPEMAFVVVGFGRKNRIRPTGARLIDLRTDRFDVDLDRLWMAYMRAADCAVGVHGSNMLLPSGLAKSTVEFVPRLRLGNTVQDFLFARDHQDARDTLLHYRMMYGNQSLSDVQPSYVADMVANVLSFATLNSARFKAERDPKTRQRFEAVYRSSLFEQAKAYFGSTPKIPFAKRGFRRLAEILLDRTDG